DAEIDNDDRARGVDEEIARVEIGVKKAVAEDLIEEGARGVRHDGVYVVPRGNEPLTVIDADAADALERQHLAAGATPIDLGHVKGRVLGEIRTQLRSSSRLEAEIHLLLDRIGQRIHHRHRLEAAQHRLRALGEPGQPEKKIKIAGEGGVDAGAQY